MIRASRRPAKAKYPQPQRERFTGTYAQRQRDLRKSRAEYVVGRLKAIALEDIDAAMVKVIIASMSDRGGVTVDDFKRSGIPPQEIEPRFRRCMNRAREQAPEICGVMANA